MTNPLLDRRLLLAAFADLDRRLRRAGVVATVHVVGGAAIALAWEDRRTTQDVDAVFDTDRHSRFIEEIRAVGKDFGIPPSWLNEQATMYAPRDYRSRASVVFDGTNLKVAAASAEAVLAMKVRAGRPIDAEDVGTLLDISGLGTAEEVLAVHDRWFPGDPLPEPKRIILEAIIRSRAGGA